MGFEQAAIKVEKEKEFGELKGVVERAFEPQATERFLKQLQGLNVRVRDWDKVIAFGALEQVVGVPVKAQELYQALPMSDQAQIREFYLSKIEEVDPKVRTKYQKIYRYY